MIEKGAEVKEENIEEQVNIAESEEVEIKIGGSKEKEKQEAKSKLAEREKKEIKEYLTSVYEIKDIIIY